MTLTPEDGDTVHQLGEQETVQSYVSDQTTVASEVHADFRVSSGDPRGDDEDVVVLGDPERLEDDVSAQEVGQDEDALPEDAPRSLSQLSTDDLRHSPSVEGSSSVPDDTPSISGLGLSSPRSETPTLQTPRSKKQGATLHRPFDLRFSSRLSSYQATSPRNNSPAFLTNHSRQSSLAGFGALSASEIDEPVQPWEVITWNKLGRLGGQIFSEAPRRSFGTPTCLTVTDQIVIGTSRGVILVFDHRQKPKAVIGSGTRANECGAVTALSISADHTTVAAGHATGHIFTWEIARPTKPFLHIPPIDNRNTEARQGDGHLVGSMVLHVGFLGLRRTALVSADDKGMAFSHLASRGTGALGRAVHTSRVLGRYPELISRSAKPPKKSSVLAFSPLPLGNIEQATDGLGLVAMLTPYLLVIVSTTPVAQTQHKAARPKEVAAHSAMTAALAWFPAIKLKRESSEISKTKLAYAWSNVLTVLDIHEISADLDIEKEKPPELQFVPRSHFKSEEAIVAIQWLSRSVMAVLTITQQLLVVEDVTMRVTESFDLLPKDIYHADVFSSQLQAMVENLDEEDTSMHGVVADAFHMSFRAYKGRIFLLSFNAVWWGTLTNWADRLLAMMDAGDFIGAIHLVTKYHNGIGEKVTIGLPEDDEARAGLVREKLLEILSASLKYAFGKNQKADNVQLDQVQLRELAVASVAACLSIDDQEFLFHDVFGWYDDHDQASLLVDALEAPILDSKIRRLPPVVLKVLINHFRTTHSSQDLEEIICLLDPLTMDLDQVTMLCKSHKLYDAYVYVWTTALQDYITPLRELLALSLEHPQANGYGHKTNLGLETGQKMFAFLSFVLTGRIYPTGISMDDEIAFLAKHQVYEHLFSGSSSSVSSGPKASAEDFTSASFSALRSILLYDTSSFMSVLNEAFEDNFLSADANDNDSNLDPVSNNLKANIYDRPLVIAILRDVMSSGFEASDTIYLDMFIARNLAKYPGDIRLTGTEMQDIVMRLSHYQDDTLREDAQLSVEYLLSVYQPPNELSLIPILREARFFRVLKTIFRREGHYADLVRTYFLDADDQHSVFDLILEYLRAGSPLTDSQRREVTQAVRDHALDLCNIDVNAAAGTADSVLPEAHPAFLGAMRQDAPQQFRYLRALLEPPSPTRSITQNLDASYIQLYVRLMCELDRTHVVDYIKAMKEEDLELDAVVPTMEANGVIDASVISMTRKGDAQGALDRLVVHIHTLRAALRGILDAATESPDVVATNEAIEDLLDSLDRYIKVGIWICQGQMTKILSTNSGTKAQRVSSTPALAPGERLWLDLLTAVVSVAQETSYTSKTPQDDGVTTSVREMVQNCFTVLLTTTATTRDMSQGGNQFVFLRILRAFLTRAAESAPSLSQLRSVIRSVFQAYAYEASLQSLSNAMLDRDLFVHVDEVSQLRRRGWRPRGQVCEICRRRLWGPGTGLKVWDDWEQRETQRTARRALEYHTAPVEDADSSRGKGKATVDTGRSIATEESVTSSALPESESGPVVVFSCRHIYHQNCLTQSQTLGDEGVPAGASENLALRCPSC